MIVQLAQVLAKAKMRDLNQHVPCPDAQVHHFSCKELSPQLRPILHKVFVRACESTTVDADVMSSDFCAHGLSRCIYVHIFVVRIPTVSSLSGP